jgi:hypothetical protein
MEQHKMRRILSTDKVAYISDVAEQHDRPRSYRKSLVVVKGVVLATILYFMWAHVVPWNMSGARQLPTKHMNATGLVDFDDVSHPIPILKA